MHHADQMFQWELLVILQLGAEWKAKKRRLGFVKKRQGRAEGWKGWDWFFNHVFCPLPFSPDPHYALFSHNEGAKYKRGSVRQKLVWVAMHSIMVGSESNVEAQLWRNLCCNGWRFVSEFPMMLQCTKWSGWSSAFLCSEVSYTCKLRRIRTQSVAFVQRVE